MFNSGDCMHTHFFLKAKETVSTPQLCYRKQQTNELILLFM